MIKVMGCVVGLCVLISLSGCNSAKHAQLHTQAQGEVKLKANQYEIQIQFSEQAKTSQAARIKLNANLADFLAWQASSGFDVATQSESVQPMYHYRKKGQRELTHYQAQHRFVVKGLTLLQYDEAMNTLAGFDPTTLNQGKVGVSDEIRQQAMAQAYKTAYDANQDKLTTLMSLSGLCQPKVSEIKEHTNAQGGPRIMSMAAKSQPVANEHTISVRLEITWKASHC